MLVVEDELLLALELSDMVEDAGCAVLGPAPTVEEALSVLAGARPAAALLDENLDGASVLPVARELARRGVPFAIVSGYVRSISDEPLLRGARRLGKPPSPRQIREVLADLLARSPRGEPRAGSGDDNGL